MKTKNLKNYNNFDNAKKQTLKKMLVLDKSIKGFVDKEIKPLVDLINKKQNYFTTSSCAGRIVLIGHTKARKKLESEWLLCSHEAVKFKEVNDILFNNPDQLKDFNEVWLLFESFILHVCCRSIEDAQKLLDICCKLGLKRTGIISVNKKIIIEILDTQRLETIAAKKGEVLIDKNYLKELVKVSNEKLKNARKKIRLLERKIKFRFFI